MIAPGGLSQTLSAARSVATTAFKEFVQEFRSTVEDSESSQTLPVVNHAEILQKYTDESRIKKVSQILEFLKVQDLTRYENVISTMPKGGILHIHLTGSIDALVLLQAAIEAKLFFNPATNEFSPQQADGFIAASDLPLDEELYYQYMQSVSMRGDLKGSINGHDHFMEAFQTIFSAISPPTATTQSLLSHVKLRPFIEKVARANEVDNVQYLELMIPLLWVPQLAEEGCFNEEVSPTVKIRYIIEISRTQSLASFEKDVTDAIALINKYPNRIFSFNPVGPEDYITAQLLFQKQMEIIARKKTDMQRPLLTIHTGELTQKYATQESMRKRIGNVVKATAPNRMGHCVCLKWQREFEKTLRILKDKDIAIEVCLQSNKGILNVEGEQHPIRTLVKDEVPVTLNTDDPAVNRGCQTGEFVCAGRDHGFEYRQLRNFALNSIRYSFLPGKKLQDCDSGPDTSEKAAEEYQLMEQLYLFENHVIQMYGHRLNGLW